jgi:hypothetical protein
VADEAKERGYHFDVSKIAAPRGIFTISVTKGQLAYELTHLKQKLCQRDPKRLRLIVNANQSRSIQHSRRWKGQ